MMSPAAEGRQRKPGRGRYCGQASVYWPGSQKLTPSSSARTPVGANTKANAKSHASASETKRRRPPSKDQGRPTSTSPMDRSSSR
jgi:hypothetical protein